MMMTNGLGATIGTLAAQSVINTFVYNPAAAGASALDIWSGWRTSWYIFAAYALIVAVLFWICFPKTEKDSK
jgi:predicted MFS family arabinose efflux permease